MNDTYINLDKLSFRIDQDVFNAKANIKNITQNPLVDAQLNGIINLGNVSKAYPIKLKFPLSGVLKADVATKFDMKSVEANQYENMQNSGNMTLTGFKYVDENNKAINVNKAVVEFTNLRINLQELDATTGKTDLRVNGVLENFYGFMFKNQELKGNFNMESNQFAVADFMTAEKPKAAEKPKEGVKISAFLNCTLLAKANTVLYDNLTLKDVSGKIIVKDQKATLENVKSSIFGGQILVSGDVSTKGKVPVFNMNLGMNAVDISQTFTQLNMMKSIAPIAGAISGKLNSTIKVAGNLDPVAMSPDLKTITGDLIGQLLATKVNPQSSELLTALGNNLKFIDLNKLNLNDVKAALTFKDGKVNVKPFDLKYQDIKVNIGGQHGFDQSMNYTMKFDVPAKYLGTEANNMIAKLSAADAKKMENVPITANVTGNFKKPIVSTDMKAAVSNLANQMVKKQKDKLISQGTSALGNIINNNTKKDTTKAKSQEDVKTKATDLIKGIFGKKK